MSTSRRQGFTLIELLIVVAIIAILAAIAVPNFLQAQTRSKISRVKSDLRTLTTALEAYYVDANTYVPGNHWGVGGARPSIPNDPLVLERLSTPIAYLSQALLPDVFVARKRSNTEINGTPPLIVDTTLWPDTPREGHPDHFLYRTYFYIAIDSEPANPSGLTRVLNGDGRNANGYIIYSSAPMQMYINAGGVVANADRVFATDLVYDPTNGTISFGNIWRPGGAADSLDNLVGAASNAL